MSDRHTMGYEEIDSEVDRIIRRFGYISTVLPDSTARRIFDVEWARECRAHRNRTAEQWEQLETQVQDLFDELTSTSEQLVTAEEHDEKRVEKLRETRDACLETTHSIQQLDDWYLYPDERAHLTEIVDRVGNYMSLVEHVLRTAETRRLEFELARELESELDEIESDLETHVSDSDPESYSPETIEKLRVDLQRIDERIEQLVTEIDSESQYETLNEFQQATDFAFDDLTLDPSGLEHHNSTGGLRERSRALENRLDRCELDHLLAVDRETLDELDPMVEQQYETTGAVMEKRDTIGSRLESVGESIERVHELTEDGSVRPAVDDLETRFENRRNRFESERSFAVQLDEGDQALQSFRVHYEEYSTADGTPTEYIARGDWEDLSELLSRTESEYRRAGECFDEDDSRTRLLQSVLRERNEQLERSRERLQRHNTEFASEIGERYPEVFVDEDGNELNDRQKEAVIADDSRVLVPAAAGTGKTKTVVHKINYLVNVEGVPAERILVAGFANASVDELNERILDPGVEADTLHSLAKRVVEIIEPAKELINDRGKIKPETKKILGKMLDDNSDYYSSKFEQDYLRLIKHMADKGTGNLPQSTTEETESTPPGLRHVEFFLDKHSIEHTTDKLITKTENENETVEYRADIYLPNYDIVISHVPVVDAPPESAEHPIDKLAALDEHSQNPQVRGDRSFGQVKANVEWERQLFEELDDTELIYTYGWEKEEGVIEDRLERRLAEQFVVPVPVDSASYVRRKNELYDGDSVDKAVRNKLAEGVGIARERGLPAERRGTEKLTPTTMLSDDRVDAGRIAELYPETSPLYRAFGNVLDQLYSEYHSHLRQRNLTDFPGWLNRATELLCEHPDHKEFERFTYDYIIVDEFQDISPIQIQFIAALLQLNTDARLFCVGDDWQSIYAFRGGTSYYFLNFEDVFERPTNTITLQRTYRNPQIAVDASVRLIENNEEQLPKNIQAVSEERGVITIHESELDEGWSDAPPQMADDVATLVERYIEGSVGATDPSEIRVLVKDKYIKQDIIASLTNRDILNEYNPDGRRSGHVSVETPSNAKGKEAKHVIIYRALDDEYGSFPEIKSKDTVLNPIKQKEDNTFQEERRRFYVALTRTSQTIDIFTSEDRNDQSRFIRELRPDFSDEEGSVSSQKSFERLLDHGIWDGGEPILEETSLTGDTALELVGHAHDDTQTGIGLFQLFSSLVTADSAPERSSDELVAFYHWYVDQADEKLSDREIEASPETALTPFVEPVTRYNRAVRRAFEHRYHEEPVSALLDVVDAVREQPLLDTPNRPDRFDDVLNRYVFGTELEAHDCPAVASVLEQTAVGLQEQPEESKRLVACAKYLRELESQYESLTVTYPFRRANELRWRIPAIESATTSLVDDEHLAGLRNIKRWSQTPDQFDIVAAVSRENGSIPDQLDAVQTDVKPTQTS